MKQRLQILNDPRFRLVYGVSQRFSDGPDPHLLRLNRQGFHLMDGIKKKTKVHPNMLLAVHPSPEKGNLFAPIFGEVSEINERSIFVTATQPFEAPDVAPTDLLAQGLEGEALCTALKEMGVNTHSLGLQCETLIINGLNPNPGVTWAEPMLATHVRTLEAGLELHRRMTRAKNIVLVVPKGSKVAYDNVTLAYVEPEYPNSIDGLVIKAVTGKEKPDNVGIVGLHNIWSLGRVARTCFPLTETVMTIGSYEHWGNYIVKDGSTVGDLLSFANISLKTGDTVVRGGPLRGESLDRFDRSVTKGTYGLFVVEAGTVPPMEGHSPCINCGACVLVCPARLSPSTLSRYAEFALHERCRKEHIESCLDCGLCGYVCIARRPVLQYIRLSKQKLAEEDARRALVEINPNPGVEGV
ncbi:MAG: electron transporter RnfC [Desulfovibrionaceae bacterium]